MFPGLQTRISEEVLVNATTLNSLADLTHITDTTAGTTFATLNSPLEGHSMVKIIVNRSGANMATTTTGNIATAVTIGQNVGILLTFSFLTGKWYPGALA